MWGATNPFAGRAAAAEPTVTVTAPTGCPGPVAQPVQWFTRVGGQWAPVGCSGEDALGVKLSPTTYPAQTRDMLPDHGQCFLFQLGETYLVEQYLEGTAPCFMAGQSAWSDDEPVIPAIGTFPRPYRTSDQNAESIIVDHTGVPRCASSMSIYESDWGFTGVPESVQFVTTDDMSGARAFLRVERLTWPARVAHLYGTDVYMSNEGDLSCVAHVPVPLVAEEDNSICMTTDMSGNEYRVTKARWLAVTLSLYNNDTYGTFDYADGSGYDWGDHNPLYTRATLIHTKAPVYEFNGTDWFWTYPDPVEVHLTDELGARSLTWFVKGEVGDTFGVRVSSTRPPDYTAADSNGSYSDNSTANLAENIRLFIRPMAW